MSKKLAVITGASYGVGQATALSLAGEGYDLALTATKRENLAGSEGLLATTDAKVHAYALNLREPKEIDEVVAAIHDEAGVPDLLVNNGGTILDQTSLEISPDDWDSVFDVNLRGTFFMTQAVGRLMIERGTGGAIVTISSSFAFKGAANRLTYGVSKAGLINMTKMLAVEWAPHDIRVNAVAPGRIDTPSPPRAHTSNDPDYMAAMLQRIPLHRLTTAEEVAAAVTYLAGDGAASMTGQSIIMDGGLTA